MDLSGYTEYAISGENDNCFFMAAYVAATLNGDPLGGGEEEAALIRSGEHPTDLEEKGLRVRGAIVEWLKTHKTEIIPAHFISGRKGPRKRPPTLTWEGLFHALKSPQHSFDDHLAAMSRSGKWGTDFEQRALLAMGLRIAVARGGNRREMSIEQQTTEYVPLRKGQSVWLHLGRCHYHVLIAA